MLKNEILFPKKVMCEGDVVGADNLMIPAPLQTPLNTYTREMTKVVGCASLILDFGIEVKASLRIICQGLNVPDGNTTKIHIRFGESLSECCSDLGQKGSCNDHSPRDFEATITGLSDNRFGQSGFRFARIDFIDPNADYKIVAIVSDGEVLDLPTKYEYKGSDEILKNIFIAAKRTIDLCSAGEYVWDGIKRDRLIWIGDMHPEMLALVTLYGRVDAMENSIRFLKDTTPISDWMCNIPTYSAWWIIVLADYFDRTDCREFVLENIDYAQKLVDRFLEVITPDGEITIEGLVDWPSVGTKDEPAGRHAILLAMAKKAEKLFKALQIDTSKATELKRRLKIDPIVIEASMTAVGLKNFAEEELTDKDIDILKTGKASGLSTFMSYYSLTAYAMYVDKNEAVEIMKEYYNGMLSRGATTFWEDFHLEWLEGSGRIDELPADNEKDLHGDYGDFCYKGFRHSLCHAWSTGIIAFMQENGL